MRMKVKLLLGSAVFLLPLLEPASAADLSVRPVAHAVVPISHWDGWYASVSAGGTWTKGDFTRTSNDVNTFTESDFDPTGALTFTSLYHNASLGLL